MCKIVRHSKLMWHNIKRLTKIQTLLVLYIVAANLCERNYSLLCEESSLLSQEVWTPTPFMRRGRTMMT